MWAVIARWIVSQLEGRLQEEIIRRAGRSKWLRKHSPHAEREIRMPHHPILAFHFCLRALEALGECSLLEADSESGRITARSPESLLATESHEIRITLAGEATGGTVVTVSSQPLMAGLTDFGRSKRQVRKICAFLLSVPP